MIVYANAHFFIRRRVGVLLPELPPSDWCSSLCSWPAAAASAVRPISSEPECARRSGAKLGSGAYAGAGPPRLLAACST